ncbi:MAG: FHA domain-containing protein [Roseburia sp.]|nr:FHA domain-containing protein [Roseburia sp.]
MEQENREKGIKVILDLLILLFGTGISVYIFSREKMQNWHVLILFAVFLFMVWTLLDLMFSFSRRDAKIQFYDGEVYRDNGLSRLILLDENDKPVKSWDMQGRTSLIIGKEGQNQELDIDLSGCEYSSFIDFQHAVLNFSLDQWYIEDMESQNGVRVRKVEDGECYKVIHRPCKVVAGDILYIANTKLLLT